MEHKSQPTTKNKIKIKGLCSTEEPYFSSFIAFVVDIEKSNAIQRTHLHNKYNNIINKIIITSRFIEIANMPDL